MGGGEKREIYSPAVNVVEELIFFLASRRHTENEVREVSEDGGGVGMGRLPRTDAACC